MICDICGEEFKEKDHNFIRRTITFEYQDWYRNVYVCDKCLKEKYGEDYSNNN